MEKNYEEIFNNFLIVFLILFTAFIKILLKRLDDEIFAVKENLRSLKNEVNDLNLEYTYLSSEKD